MKKILRALPLLVLPALLTLANRPGAPDRCALAKPGTVRVPLAKGVIPTRPLPNPPSAGIALKQIAELPLPGRPVRFDYQSQDSVSGQLYISHMNDGEVLAFDTRARKVAGSVPDLPGVTGVWVVPELHKLYASATGHHAVAIVDLPALTRRAMAGPIAFPDGIAYAPGSKRVFVSDESGGIDLVIDGVNDRVVTRIALGGEAGNTKYDAGSGCILVAVQTRNQIVAIDPGSAQVVGRFAPAGADHPHGMLVDPGHRLLVVANQGNASLEVIDLTKLEVVDIEPTGDDPDVLAYDPGLQRLYVATEGGGLWIYRLDNGRLRLEGSLELPHAHTVSVDPATHLVYVPLQNLGGRPMLRIFDGSRP